jgi:predicted GIY-YIG superfamily endonuclease
MSTIYVLRLEGGRYYVGKSDNVMKRYQQHLDGSGSAWTRKYPPVSLEKTIEHASPFEEDKVTKEYMSRYGVDRVRGGSYVELELSESQTDALQRELWAAKDLCTRCGRSGHFVKDCHATTNVSGHTIENEETDEQVIQMVLEYLQQGSSKGREKPSATKGAARATKGAARATKGAARATKGAVKGAKGGCYRCGRPGHYSPDCYARTHQKGYALDSGDSDSDESYDSDEE